MRVSVSSLLVLTLSALGKAAPVQDDVPALPNGAFTGINNADGTTTLTFVDTNEVFTFKPTAPPPLQSRNEGLNSRAAIGPTDCWRFQGALNRQGVDSGVQQFRNRLTGNSGFWLGKGKGAPYFGYNNNGVYVYFCVNTKDQWSTVVTINHLNDGTYWTDQDCGPYQAGYVQWNNSPLLFGKTISGTAVCLGS